MIVKLIWLVDVLYVSDLKIVKGVVVFENIWFYYGK